MKIQKTKLGFTLIELMVVITIIGILATGAVSVYTSQIQKARDSNRITSLKAFQWALEQAYSDASVYPDPGKENTIPSAADCSSESIPIRCITSENHWFWYMPSLPKDVKSWQSWSNSGLDFVYRADTVDSVVLQWFEVSCWFEASASVASKASKDNWNDLNRFEVWNYLDWNTVLNQAATASQNSFIKDDWTTWTSADGKIVIKW